MAFDASDHELRAKLAQACRILAMEGHSDMIWGHMSVRDPLDPGRLWMKAHELGLEEITPEDTVLIDRGGQRLAGTRRVHREFPIHSEVLHRRSDLHAVIHTHSMIPTVLVSGGETIRPLTHEGAYFYPPAIPLFSETTDLIVTRELGEAVARTLGDQRALVLQNHGIVVTGRSIEEAVFAAVLLNRAAEAQLAAASLGREVASSSDAEARLKRQRLYGPDSVESAWQYLVRKEQRWDKLPR